MAASIDIPIVLEPYVYRAMSNLRYGNLFDEFTGEELSEYAHIKAKRALLLLRHQAGVEKVVDDLLDAANLCFMAAKRVEDENGSNKSGTSPAEDTSGTTETGPNIRDSGRQTRPHVVYPANRFKR